MSEKRYVKLTPEQLKTLRLSNRKRSVAPKLIADLLDELTDRLAEETEEFWDQVHAIAGTTEDKNSLTIRWAVGDIAITDLEGTQDDT